MEEALMKKLIKFLGLFVFAASVAGCSTGAADTSLDSDSDSDDIDSSEVDDYPLRDQYVSTSSLTMAKGVDMDKIEAYAEAHLADDGWPRVRKYQYNELDSYDDEWYVMGNYNATYCYKYYDGRTYSNGNTFYMKEFYVLPEFDRFVFNYTLYEYPVIEIGSLTLSAIRAYTATFTFTIDESASDVNFGGSYYYQAVDVSSLEITSWANIAFLFDFDYMIPSASLPYMVDASFTYAIGDCSGDEITNAFLNETASTIYSYLNGQMSFANEFLELVDSSYKLVSE